jgi:hypothetical protein
MAAKLKWRNASNDNPGFTVWYANPERNPNVLYAIRRKRPTKRRSLDQTGAAKTPNVWRVFMRSAPAEPLRTIFVAPTLDGEGGAKTFVQDWEEMISVSLEAVPAPTV